jgi:hypothetical protein
VQNSFGLRHGAPGPQVSVLHCMSTVTKHAPGGGGGGHIGTQNSFGKHGRSGPHASFVHCRASVSKHVPVGGGDAHAGEQNSFGSGHPLPGEQMAPVHAPAMVSKQPPLATQAPACSLHTPACRRRQSLPYVVPSQPQTGATASVQTSGRTVQTPAVFVQLPRRHSQNAPAGQSLSASQVVHTLDAATSGHACATSRRTFLAHRPGKTCARCAARSSAATQVAYPWCGAQQLHCNATAASAVATAVRSAGSSPHLMRAPASLVHRSERMTARPAT